MPDLTLYSSVPLTSRHTSSHVTFIVLKCEAALHHFESLNVLNAMWKQS